MEISVEHMSKSIEFKEAMDKYYSNVIYHKFQIFISIISVNLQALSLYFLIVNNSYNNFMRIDTIILFFGSYIFTDFINGLIHMYMDNNNKYKWFWGPFIAHFHLHHKKLFYTKKHVLRVWIDETGYKIWLAIYLIILLILQKNNQIPFRLEFCLVCIGILSSFAELSHYWCHTPSRTNRLIRFLQNAGILLNMTRHKIHHSQDNTHYAFLCGISDPIINFFAKKLCAGYKNESDLHAKAYKLPD